LTTAEQSINQAQNSLEMANKSFEQFAKESKAEQNRLTWQRNIFAAAAIYLVLKK
jgi:hypothetical protein